MLLTVLEMAERSEQYKQQNAWINERYVTVSAKLPKDFVQEFKGACKALGVSQSEVFRQAMQNTINQAKK